MNKQSKNLGLVCAAVMMVIGIISSTNAQGDMSMKSKMNKMSSTDEAFMMTAAKGGMSEVEMARVALQQSSNDSVKQYAQKMIDDHTMAGEELKQLATAKGVMLPMEPDARQSATMSKMQKSSGMDFDRMYVKVAGIKAHQDMEKLFMKESSSGKDTEAKAFAAKTLPVVRMHLQMARDLMMNMKGMKNGAFGMRSSGN